MPQKQNPIDSEVVVGLSVLAAQQVPALLVAMQPGHERAAGEWHVEWDALPLVAAYAAGAVAGATGVVRALRVAPDRMRANLELEGGTVMAEALMMAAAPTLGRQRAHDLRGLGSGSRRRHLAPRGSGRRRRARGCGRPPRRRPRAGELPRRDRRHRHRGSGPLGRHPMTRYLAIHDGGPSVQMMK
jgi:hypothetical protein